MNVLHCCSELFPLLKTGGLADVMGSLPLAQKKIGLDARVVIPAFPAIKDNIADLKLVTDVDTFAGHISLLYGQYQGVDIYLIDAPHLYQRAGSPYHDEYQHAYSDNVFRFALLGWVASELSAGLDPLWHADIVHAHDWHAGLACAYLAVKHYPAKSVFTVHNLAYKGEFSPYHLHQLELPDYSFSINGLEYYGQISFLKAGLFYANHITTVSPTYAKEITRPEFGYGLEGLLRQRTDEQRLSGILNGIDEAIWEPATDNLITRRYDINNLNKRLENKTALQKKCGLPVNNNAPLFAVVSRLTSQKGLDLVIDVLPDIVDQGGQFVLLGTGDSHLESAFLHAQQQYPQHVATHIGYDESFSHQVIAGADVIMVPSRFEPCGLTQLYGLKYGALPLVRHTGGLADTVNDCSLENLAHHKATGFVFHEATPDDLRLAINRAFTLWGMPKQWQQVQTDAMSQTIFSWETAAKTYAALYHRL
ncbi:glycogen synthase GlgA [Proteus vulgaris]|uniref:glycogen synthase GlgA n=1 Tax=Proteus vulgaris TaxID=585 RepID=UPI001B38E33F|nr:glycogen synthase GlgA [Proteus vulgaris]MBQ0212933.1 glycogen synthase GlgA [Proteus vulgaris]MDS0788533.1 glycogen synthase GlgA [Proteus vulgaris]